MLCFVCTFQFFSDVSTRTYSFIYSHTERVFLLTFKWHHTIYIHDHLLKKNNILYTFLQASSCVFSSFYGCIKFHIFFIPCCFLFFKLYTYFCLHWCLWFCGKGSQTCGFWVKTYVMCNTCSFYQIGGGDLAHQWSKGMPVSSPSHQVLDVRLKDFTFLPICCLTNGILPF